MTWETKLSALLGHQHRLVTREQVVAFGCPTRTIERKLASGVWTVVHPGVYDVGGGPLSQDRDRMAAWLAAGPGAVFSHRTAASMWGFERSGRRLFELTVPRWRGTTPQNVILHRITDIEPERVVIRSGLPYTDPVRTLVDIGAVLPQRLVGMAAERAFSERQATPRGVWEYVAQISRQGRAGAGVMKRVLDERALGDKCGDGLLEPRMATMFRDFELPPAAFQYEVRLRERVMRIDFVYADVMLAMEVDGYKWHRTLEQIQDDHERQNLIVELGYHPLRFTWRHVVQRPRYVASTIRRVRAQLAGISV